VTEKEAPDMEMQPDKELQWLNQVRRARTEPWTMELARCLSCKALGTTCRFGIIEEIVVENGIDGRAELGPQHEGGPDVAHGGVVAGILDEVVGHAAMSRGLLVVTRTLTIDYLKPTPLATPLTLASRVDLVDGRKWTITGTISLPGSGTVVARGTGVWIVVPDSHFERHRNSMQAESQPDQAASGSAADAGDTR
jgi:acyl-coenzyme A thioesterase PaaI-like protein